MTRRPGHILSFLPRRRSRQWRYVSPHRRGAGAFLLVLLAIGVAGYWLLPRALDSWTRRLAEEYLDAFTGGQASVRGATFRLFGGIELQGVRLDVQTPHRRERVFQAGTIVIRHRPWSLLTAGRLEPTELVCIAPTVALVYDAQRGRYAIQDLIDAARRGRSTGALSGPLPVISIRDARLQMLSGAEPRLNISLTPTGRIYRIRFEERSDSNSPPLGGSGRLDLATGRFHLDESSIPSLAQTDTILPERYARWRKAYALQGKVVLRGRPTSAPAESALDVELQGVSLRLRKEEGGLQLEGVHGTLCFDRKGIHIHKLEGRIPKAQNARLTLSGDYRGLDANSPFGLNITIEGMVLPDASGATGRLARTLEFLHQTFRPRGRMDIHAELARSKGGEVRLVGRALPKEMSFVYRLVPYALDQTAGTIHFETDSHSGQVRLEGVRGRHGRAEVTVDGTVDMWRKGYHDVRVVARNVPLDADLRAALPPAARAVWDRFRPRGRAGGEVRVRRDGPDAPERTVVTLELDGGASAEYETFPYRIEQMTGRIVIDGARVTVSSLAGRRGPMRCTVDGEFTGPGGESGRTELTIEATDLPLDANLLAALPRSIRPAAASLHAAGTAEDVRVSIRREPGSPADIGITARIADAALRPDALPLPLTDVSATLTVGSGRLRVDGLRGRLGNTPIDANARITPTEDGLAVALDASARGLPLNRALFDALPAEAKRIWRMLSPSGRADVDFALRPAAPGAADATDWSMLLRPRGMGIRYAEFPYALDVTSGEVHVTSREAALADIVARHGPAELVLNGRLTFGDDQAADLAVSARGVPIDAELIAAIPEALAPLAGRFRPGGRCDLELSRLRYVRRAPPAATSGPTSRPARADRWALSGWAAFHQAVMDLGLGHKTLSGRLSGRAEQGPAGLTVEADAALKSVRVGNQLLTDLRARLQKRPTGDVLRIDKLTARAHKGQVAGFAEVRLAEPAEFGLSLSVTGMDLGDLVRAELPNPRRRPDLAGTLAGNVRLTVRGGARPLRQAEGLLRITDGKLYRMPVVLGLMNVIYLTLPGQAPFTYGTVRYEMTNDTLIFRELYLRGPTASIVGSGTLDLKTDAVDLKFVSGATKTLPRLGSLTELLEGIAREVAELHVTGTIDKPRFRTLPLRNLDRLLHDLLNPGTKR